MESTEELRMYIMDNLRVLEPVCNFVNRDDFSVIDMAINGDGHEAVAYRIRIAKLPRIFEDDEKAAEKAARLLDKNA